MQIVERIGIEEFIAGLRGIPAVEFTKDRVLHYLKDSLLDLHDLERFTSWQKHTYTRNLIYKDDLFEVLALCWDVGQESPIHNHSGQLGWVMVQKGIFSVTNYRLISCEKPDEEVTQSDLCAGGRRVRIEETSQIAVASVGAVATVDKRLTIHKISNFPSFGERTISVHIYSRPYDSCVVYDTEKQMCRRVKLRYHTINGAPTEEFAGEAMEGDA